MARCGGCARRRPLGAQDPHKPQDPRKPGEAGKEETKKSPASHTTGRTQSFALQTPDGKTRYYGSRLERDAARVRHGGRIL